MQANNREQLLLRIQNQTEEFIHMPKQFYKPYRETPVGRDRLLELLDYDAETGNSPGRNPLEEPEQALKLASSINGSGASALMAGTTKRNT